MNNNDNRNRQKKKNSPLAIAFAVLLAFFSIAESAGGAADVSIGIIVIIAIILAVFFVVGKLSKKVREKGGAAVKDSVITRFSRDSGETPPVTASRPKTFIYDAMDITMPEMDGIEALKAIRAMAPGSTVVMCSAMGQQAMVIEAIQAGAKDFIVKPFQADRVLEAVKKAIG